VSLQGWRGGERELGQKFFIRLIPPPGFLSLSVDVCAYLCLRLRGYLSALVSTGLYGKNPADAAERLLAKGVEQAISTGTIQTAVQQRTAGIDS
jgi:hypothetical protein